MSQQLTLPFIPAAPRWWDHVLDFFLVEFLFQPTHSARGRVLGKQYHPSYQFWMGGGAMTPNVLVTVKAWWELKVRTPHGIVGVKISERLFDLIRKGDSAKVEYRLSRLYATNQYISGKLMQ